MRKPTFDKRMNRLQIIAYRASSLSMEDARSLLVETKAPRSFNGLIRDFLRRYAGHAYQPEDTSN